MFPNVRLMIAAMLASVVALVCGFGLFAVFRVSHEPFARAHAATASLRLVADNAVFSAPGLASSAAFDRRLQVAAEPNAAATTDIPEATGEHQAETEAAPATTPDPSATAPEQASSESEEATEQPSAAVTPASNAAVTGAESAAADDGGNVASLFQPQATPDATAIAPEQETKPPPVSMADAGPTPSAAAVAVNDPHDVQPPLRERVNVTGPPADDAGPSGEGAHKAALKKRMQVVVRIRRVPSVAAIRYAPTQFSQARYTPVAEQNFGGTQINFPTAPPQSQYSAPPTAPVRYVRLVARKPRAPSQDANTATGGPFVSVTNR
jgi:hypothetical protein